VADAAAENGSKLYSTVRSEMSLLT
jgi:hypothetical protein